MNLTTDKSARKEQPVARGVLDYFPNAIAEVARVSFVGNQQHNPGQEMHWARGKSADHADCIARHLIERGTLDDDGLLHSAKAAWRALALLQLEIEAAEANKQPVNPTMIPPPGYRFTGSSTAEIAPDPVPTQRYYDPTFGFEMEKPKDVYTLHLSETGEPKSWGEVNGSGNPEVTGSYAPAERPTALELEIDNAFINVLLERDSPDHIAKQIAAGTTHYYASDKFVYVAGPMRGIDQYNFPAFDAARDRLHTLGYSVISPADIDRGAGDTTSDEKTLPPQYVYAFRDFYSLYLIRRLTSNGAIAMLPGWEKSTGAVAEFFLARWLGLKVLDATSGEPLVWTHVQIADLWTAVVNFLEKQTA